MLDAQYFNVAQRRKRVFVVGYLGDWRRAAAVLFERESMSGHPAPSREAGQKAAPTVTQGAPFSRTGSMYDPFMETLPIGWSEELNALTDLQPTIQRGGAGGRHEGVMVPVTTGSLCARTGQSISVQDAARSHLLPIAFGAQNSSSQGDSVSTEVTPTLDKSKTPAVAMSSAVRRLTPTECERLQGFPDNFTQIPWRNKAAEDCPDGPRYKAMGNSMAVPVMRWIGERIDAVEGIDQ